MVNVGSLPVSGKTLFDLDTQAGITAVLLAVRTSELEAAQKNELRDLIFSYTNGGRDQTVKLSLEQKIAFYKLEPSTVVVSKMQPPEPKRELPTIGTYRSTPSFVVPAAPVVAPAPSPVAAPEPEVVKIKPLFSAQPAPTPAQEESLPPADVVVPPVAMPKADQQQYLERIREIKSLVNEKVGNPVNLVDINNEVGREYMSALLDAMKRINSGMSADGAMQRLEAAYVAVEETLRSVAVEKPSAPSVTPIPTTASAPEPMSVYASPEPVVQRVPAYEPVVPPPQPQYQPVVQQPTPLETHVEPVVSTPSYSMSVAPAQPTVHTPTPHTFSSLADMVQQSHAQSGLPVTPVAPTPLQSGDPLLSAEVEEGLSQLLSEWSIFKKSGIFGTGPKGREHPLYKKMAELQIPLLLAGRFEGATQEVRQSLTDYMNGWRYEQGLIYEKGETFEHYLRRVIRHILDANSR
jgi:hypothetical protein